MILNKVYHRKVGYARYTVYGSRCVCIVLIGVHKARGN